MLQQKMASWHHAFKLDPDRDITDEALQAVCQSGTDGIIVGGSTGVTYDNTLDLLSRIRRYNVPAVLEISSVEGVVPGFDGYLIPLVLNAGEADWIFKPHLEALKEFGTLVNWDQVLVEGYAVLNGDAAVARVTNADEVHTMEDCLALARLSDQLLRLPAFYMEYSGTYGNPDWVKAVRGIVQHGLLIYGGGIRTAAQAEEIACHADITVVGNVIYDDMTGALATVSAVKRIKERRDTLL